MALTCLLPSEEWDFPFFKRLANNDTGAASGNQAGVVIPIPLRKYFPELEAAGTSATNPAIGRRVKADLFIENQHVGTANSRYQYQTWKGTRSAESRLTDELSPMRNHARGGDILIFQRHACLLDYYKLTLVRQSSPDFQWISETISSQRWGALGEISPMTQTDLENALAEEQHREVSPFMMFDESARLVESKTKKVSRSVAFRETVCRLYEQVCTICGSALRIPEGSVELDAAHIVPRSRFGADDARNGIALCKRHHWAFDSGLFGISHSLKVLVPSHVAAIPQNVSLQALNGSPLRPPTDTALVPHPDALEWHRKNVMLRE